MINNKIGENDEDRLTDDIEFLNLGNMSYHSDRENVDK